MKKMKFKNAWTKALCLIVVVLLGLFFLVISMATFAWLSQSYPFYLFAFFLIIIYFLLVYKFKKGFKK